MALQHATRRTGRGAGPDGPPVEPSDVSEEVGPFDRFAGLAGDIVSRAPFFAFCVALIVIWVPTLFVLPIDTSQLLINTATTIVTFLLVALLQNTQERANAAVQHKLNAIAAALASLVERAATADESASRELSHEAGELRSAVGLEFEETT